MSFSVLILVISSGCVHESPTTRLDREITAALSWLDGGGGPSRSSANTHGVQRLANRRPNDGYLREQQLSREPRPPRLPRTAVDHAEPERDLHLLAPAYDRSASRGPAWKEDRRVNA